MHTVKIPNCYSHYFCVTVLVVKEVLHLPICKELAAYQSRYQAQRMSSAEKNQEHWYLSPFHCSLTLWYPPSSQLKSIWSLKQKCIVHTECTRLFYPTVLSYPPWHIVTKSQNSLLRSHKGLRSPPKIKICITNFIWPFLNSFPYQSHFLKSYTRSVFYYLYIFSKHYWIFGKFFFTITQIRVGFFLLQINSFHSYKLLLFLHLQQTCYASIEECGSQRPKRHTLTVTRCTSLSSKSSSRAFQETKINRRLQSEGFFSFIN